MDEKRVEEYTKRMRECANDYDTDAAHSKADSILVEFIKELGFEKLARLYSKVKKWYA